MKTVKAWAIINTNNGYIPRWRLIAGSAIKPLKLYLDKPQFNEKIVEVEIMLRAVPKRRKGKNGQ